MAGALPRDVLRAGDVEAGKRERTALRQHPQDVHRLGAEHLRHPRRGVQVDAPASGRSTAAACSRRSGLTAVAWPTAASRGMS